MDITGAFTSEVDPSHGDVDSAVITQYVPASATVQTGVYQLIVTGLTSGQTYYARVSAYNAARVRVLRVCVYVCVVQCVCAFVCACIVKCVRARVCWVLR